MRATVIHGPRDVRVEQLPDPVIHRPTDAVVRVVATCVCGSDLWGYRGVRPPKQPQRIGHEFVGVVEEVGGDVRRVKVGDFVVAPFSIADGTCAHCRNGVHTSCEQVAWWGSPDHEGIASDGAQGEYVRVPLADGTLVVTPEHPDEALLPHVLTLTDVLGTGHHAALSAGVHTGSRVAVVGDGAVGLCGIIAARRLGAERIVAFSRNPARQALARRFGATDVVAERGDEGAAAVVDLLDGVGPDGVLECVGTKESMAQALATVRPGGRVGFVGVPAGGPELPVQTMFSANKGVVGGVAPVRGYIEGLLPDVWAGTIEPGLVFDATFALGDIADAYRAMDERTCTKALVLP